MSNNAPYKGSVSGSGPYKQAVKPAPPKIPTKPTTKPVPSGSGPYGSGPYKKK